MNSGRRPQGRPHVRNYIQAPHKINGFDCPAFVYVTQPKSRPHHANGHWTF